ncbi:glycosyltransferase family 4 protein [Nocardioides sp.]|uniref:glycosyltransferase family 4 protein n=1 Tax=Nocardioides sp. TaxID=35761 RepID=UPI002ED85BD7
MSDQQPRTILVANPSADVYGSDLQMRESVAAFRERGIRVVVVVPALGPLVAGLRDLGAEIRLLDYPVLCRSAASVHGLAHLAEAAGRALPGIRRLVREVRPDLVYVNTLTLPWWLLATRGTGVPALCHVHEAEAADPPAVRRALALPLLLADTVVANSRTTQESLLESVPALAARLRLVCNGIPGPPRTPRLPRHDDPGAAVRLVTVGRLSRRKSPDTALEAAALLRARGYDVHLELCGTPAPGQEDYAAGLRERAQRPDLRGAVTFAGYVAPVWPALERADLLLAPSLGESFGNAVVEAQLARRPVVAAAVPGHLETIRHGVTGLLVTPRDPRALADAVGTLVEDPGLALLLGDAGRRAARWAYGVARYRSEIADVAARCARAGAQTRSSAGQGLLSSTSSPRRARA